MFDGLIEAMNTLAMGLAEATGNLAMATSSAFGNMAHDSAVWLQAVGEIMLATIARFNGIMLDWLETVLLA